MTKEQFANLRVGDRVLYTPDGVYGTITETRPCNDGVRILWQDGMRDYADSTDPNQSHANIVSVKVPR